MMILLLFTDTSQHLADCFLVFFVFFSVPLCYTFTFYLVCVSDNTAFLSKEKGYMAASLLAMETGEAGSSL